MHDIQIAFAASIVDHKRIDEINILQVPNVVVVVLVGSSTSISSSTSSSSVKDSSSSGNGQ